MDLDRDCGNGSTPKQGEDQPGFELSKNGVTYTSFAADFVDPIWCSHNCPILSPLVSTGLQRVPNNRQVISAGSVQYLRYCAAQPSSDFPAHQHLIITVSHGMTRKHVQDTFSALSKP